MNEGGELDSRCESGSVGVVLEVYRVGVEDWEVGEGCYLVRVMWGRKKKSVYYLSDLEEFVRRSGC